VTAATHDTGAGMRRLFVSDVHLSAAGPERTARWVAFLERETPRADELYILGDLFDYWIGPKHLLLPDYAPALAALRRAVAGGLRIVFIKGNRDFYMRGFAEATGVEVVPGGTQHRLEADGQRVFLCHGDYMEGRGGFGFRVQEFIRSPAVEWLWTRLPAFVADLGARFYRWVSGRKTRRPRARPAHLGPHGLSEECVAQEFRLGTDVIVCGHVHEAREVRSDVDGRPALLFTLGDWTDGVNYLEQRGGAWRLCREPA
jgi:UDP-2,3-diacylglucosamine hydrolase